MILQVCPANGENKIENQALTKIQSDEEEIVDFSAQFVKSQEILKSEDDDHSGVQKARKIKFSPLKNPTSISDDIASLSAKGPDDISEENKIENQTLTKIQLADEEEIIDFSVVKSVWNKKQILLKKMIAWINYYIQGPRN